MDSLEEEIAQAALEDRRALLHYMDMPGRVSVREHRARKERWDKAREHLDALLDVYEQRRGAA